MRKNASFITLGAPVLGIFALLLRWLQISNIFEEDTGLPIFGKGISYVFAIFCVLAVAYLFLVAYFSGKRFSLPKTAKEGFKTKSILSSIGLWPIAVIVAICGLVLMFKSSASSLPAFQRLWAAFMIFAASGIPFVPGKKNSEEVNSLGKYAGLTLVLFGCVWLVFSYKGWSENPIVWAYCVEILALCSLCLALYGIGGYFFDRGRPGHTLFYMEIAEFFLIATLPDDRSTILKAVILMFVFALMIYEYIFVSNFAPPKDNDEDILT